MGDATANGDLPHSAFFSVSLGPPEYPPYALQSGY